MDKEEQIRQIAYEIWEAEGHPEGKAIEHYFRAEALWQQHNSSPISAGHSSQAAPISTPTIRRAQRSRKGHA